MSFVRIRNDAVDVHGVAEEIISKTTDLNTVADGGKTPFRTEYYIICVAADVTLSAWAGGSRPLSGREV